MSPSLSIFLKAEEDTLSYGMGEDDILWVEDSFLILYKYIFNAVYDSTKQSMEKLLLEVDLPFKCRHHLNTTIHIPKNQQ